MTAGQSREAYTWIPILAFLVGANRIALGVPIVEELLRQLVMALSSCVLIFAIRLYFERKEKRLNLAHPVFPVESWRPQPITNAGITPAAPIDAAGTPGGRVPRNRVDLTGRTFVIDRDVMRGEWIITATLRASKGDRDLSHNHEIVLDPEGARELSEILPIARGR